MQREKPMSPFIGGWLCWVKMEAIFHEGTMLISIKSLLSDNPAGVPYWSEIATRPGVTVIVTKAVL
jgi:hypothetical protein